MLGPVHAQVSRRVKVSVGDRGFPALTGRSGTQRALACGRARRLAPGALVLVTTERATHYEGVPVRCSRVQSPCQLHVRWLLLVVIIGR